VLHLVASVSEVIVIFLQLILFANTGAFFCSLLGLVSHSLKSDTGEEVSRRLRRKDQSLNAILSLFQEAYKPAFHSYSVILE